MGNRDSAPVPPGYQQDPRQTQGYQGGPGRSPSPPALEVNSALIKDTYNRLKDPSTGRIHRSSFHECLRLTEEMGMRRLKGTPLGERLFQSFDSDGSGTISEQEFSEGLSLLAGGSVAQRLELTFLAYSAGEIREGAPVVLLSSVCEIMGDSWVAAWESLLDSKTDIPRLAMVLHSDPHLESSILRFAALSAEKVKAETWEEVSRFDQGGKGFLSRDEFFRWVSARDRTVKATLGDLCSSEVPVSLASIQKPRAYPTL